MRRIRGPSKKNGSDVLSEGIYQDAEGTVDSGSTGKDLRERGFLCESFLMCCFVERVELGLLFSENVCVIVGVDGRGVIQK